MPPLRAHCGLTIVQSSKNTSVVSSIDGLPLGSLAWYPDHLATWDSEAQFAAVKAYYETGSGVGIFDSRSSSSNEISIYPNPVSSILNIYNAENANIQVYDVLGKLILTRDNISFEEQINVSQLTTGTYFIKIQKGNTIATERFIVSK